MALLDTFKRLLGSAWHVNSDAALAALLPATDGVVESGKVIVPAGADKTVDALDITALKVGGVAVSATAAELNLNAGQLATTAEVNRAADVSTRIVPLAVSTAITELAHDGKTIVMSGAGSARTFTLPAATASGARFRFVVGEVNTSNYLFKSVVGTDLFEGALLMVCDGGDTIEAFEGGATDDTITLNGTTTGGAAIGDWIEFEDFSATGWAIRGVLTGTGDEVTPFSDSVA